MKREKNQKKILSIFLITLMMCTIVHSTVNAQSDLADDLVPAGEITVEQDDQSGYLDDEDIQDKDITIVTDDIEAPPEEPAEEPPEEPHFVYDQQPATMAEVLQAINHYQTTGIKVKWEFAVSAAIIPDEWRCELETNSENGMSYWTLFQNPQNLTALSAATVTVAATKTDANDKGSSTQQQDSAKETDERKLSTKISVSYPASGSMNFSVSEETYPYIKSGYYTFTNESDYPVKVTFARMTVNESAGLEFVSDASASTPGSKKISINLITPAGKSENGFKNGVGGIKSGSHAVELGTLKGKYVSGENATTASGYLGIDGYYAGYLGNEAKHLSLSFKFIFTLVTNVSK